MTKRGHPKDKSIAIGENETKDLKEAFLAFTEDDLKEYSQLDGA